LRNGPAIKSLPHPASAESTNEADQQDLTARLFPMLLARDPLAAATLAQNVGQSSLREEYYVSCQILGHKPTPARPLEWASNLNDSSEAQTP